VAKIKTMHDAFLHELSDTYDAEQQLSQAMQEMLGMAQHPQVKQGLQDHIEETKRQVKNLDHVFKSLGAKAEKVTCKGIAGIISENKSTLKEIKDATLLDGAIVAGGYKCEHYEIATYRTLINKALVMGHTEAAELLQQNLRMEEQFAERLEQVGKQLDQGLASTKPQVVGHEIPGGSALH
jgi:ferritin-like metal-binding protein YciE